MWHIIHTAQRGRGHIKEKLPCQDKTHYTSSKKFTCIALADGAGSAKLSQLGARKNVIKICKVLKDNFTSFLNEENALKVKEELIKSLSEDLNSLANKLNCDLKDLASTLLFVACNQKDFIIGHIGDGLIAYIKEGQIKPASKEDKEDFVNSTNFVSSKNVLSKFKLIKGKLDKIDAFILMSDGAQESLFRKKDEKFALFLEKLFKLQRKRGEKVAQKILEKVFKNKIIKATKDDCSLIMMSKKMGLKRF
ncbi:protein phosphatase 2C domain-containing protein [Campylobacter sp. MIT 99-7217]|uniref:PP2C family serine/threonine-protein phosphatase n=1 Tax=Campylobacter sp. MIT 99-7217 TaxID=535091 RepID=UPI00115A713A|nr:PP2C family serine/threonine-protein phosphatase [Campylobacter sp. MIT 99-7217]TQR34428.1 protein phosphatase 2C domain-containing protein [Campylobacter sp. MIT 99-7217]